MFDEPMASPEESSYLFVYGLVDAGAWTDGGAGLRSVLSELPGVEPYCPPAVLVVGRLGVLVSAVPGVTYSGSVLEARMQELDWLEPRARAHAAVIAAVFAHEPILPLRFGTLFSGPDALAVLALQEEALLAELAGLAGQEEWMVRFCTDPDAAVEQYAAEQAPATSGGPGAQYLRRRQLALQGGKDVLARLLARAEAAADALAPFAQSVRRTQTEVTGLAGNQRSLLSLVYRLDKGQREAFEAKVAALAEPLATGGFRMLVSGPWPPTRLVEPDVDPHT